MVRIRPTRKTVEILNSFKTVDKRFDVGTRHGLYRAGKLLKKVTQDGIKKGPKTGRWYASRRKNGGRHRASATGEYPANDTGELRRSIGFKVEGTRRLIFGADTDYALPLHDKHPKGGGRPFLTKTVEATHQQVLHQSNKYYINYQKQLMQN